MKNFKFIFTVLLLGLFAATYAQTEVTDILEPEKELSGFQFSVRGGYDFPSYTTKAAAAPIATREYLTGPFIDYKGGFMAGLSVDYYFSWIGLGVDFDYIRNKPKNTYPTNLYDPYEYKMTKFQTVEENINRIFYGIGPDFKFLEGPKTDFEFKLRAGLASIKGGRTEFSGQAEEAQAHPLMLLNYHEGFDLKNVFTGKASLQFNYMFSPNVGFSIGGYYMHHFKTEESFNSALGMAYGNMIPHDLFNDDGSYMVYDPSDEPMAKRDKIDAKINSFGVFGGLVFRLNKPAPKPEEPEKPVYDIVVGTKDAKDDQMLPGVNVQLVDSKKNVVQTGITGADGTYTFTNVDKGNYTIKGSYNGKDLSEATVQKSEFDNYINTNGIYKEIILPDNRNQVQGKVVDCETGEAIANAEIIVTNTKTSATENYRSDSNGAFSFYGDDDTIYTLRPKKSDYMAQGSITVNTNDYNKDKSPIIQVQLCMDKVSCNDAIVLKNILYDLDKSFIREDAKPELDRLVQFMKDNPEVVVELSSHTDSRASDAYNEKLSQRRAQAAVDYLISKGISANRLIAKGYGESRLLNRCSDGVKCSEEEHQLNRRTEMKVICPK